MALQVWLPLTKDLRQQGLANTSSIILISGNNLTTGGKVGGQCLALTKLQTILGNSSCMSDKKQISYAYWVKVNTAWSTNWLDGIRWTSSNGSTTSIARQEFYTNCTKIGTWFPSSSTNSISGKDFTPGVWTHLAATFDYNTGDVSFYINGVLQGHVTTLDTTYYCRGDFYIGDNGVDISMNDVRIYDHCLSPMEVKQISQGLVLHYPLNRQGWGQENLYTTSQDFSGSWNNKGSWTTSEETYQNFIVKQKSTVWGGLSQNIPCSNGDIFTISFYAKVDTGGRICSIHRSSLGNVTTGLTILGGNFISGTDWINATNDGTQWKRYWATVRIDSSDITYLQWRIENSVADKTLYICGMKMERGSIATPWCPNSSDVLATTMGLNGTTEYDCSGFCNNGTKMTNTITYTSDTAKYAVSTRFNGTYDGIIIENFNLKDIINSAVTYAFWIKPESESGARSVYFGSYNTGPSWSIEKTTGNIMRLYWNGSPDETCSGATITDGVWQHICITKNGTNDVKVYINGVQKWTSTATHSNLNFPTTYRIGRDTRSNDGTPYKGLMSDFRIYATALSADEVKSLYDINKL